MQVLPFENPEPDYMYVKIDNDLISFIQKRNKEEICIDDFINLLLVEYFLDKREGVIDLFKIKKQIHNKKEKQ